MDALSSLPVDFVTGVYCGIFAAWAYSHPMDVVVDILHYPYISLTTKDFPCMECTKCFIGV